MFFHKPPLFSAETLVADMHAHLLPGIDDGPQSLAESLQLIRQLSNLGYRKLIATPHVYPAYYPNTPKTILDNLHTVQQALLDDGQSIVLEASAEYFLDESFENLLETGDLLPLPHGYLLFEMSFFAPYPRVHDVVYHLRLRDYKPVLAHPERYNYYHGKGFEALETLWQHGCRLQVNLLALDGAYGPAVQKQAVRLLDAGMVDFLGTDAHSIKHAEALRKMRVKGLEKHTFSNASL